MGGMRGSSLCSAISSNCSRFFLLPLTARILEWGGYIHCHHFITTHSHFHSFWKQPATPTIQLKAPSETPPQTSSCQIQLVFSQPSIFLSGLCQPSLSRVSSPQFQPPNTCVLESARPGLGHSPKLSFLICKMGLIKPIISVWPTHRQLPNCSPYFPLISHMSYCQICRPKLPCSESSSNIQRLESSDSIALHTTSPQAARSGPRVLQQQEPAGTLQDQAEGEGPLDSDWPPSGLHLIFFYLQCLHYQIEILM